MTQGKRDNSPNRFKPAFSNVFTCKYPLIRVCVIFYCFFVTGHFVTLQHSWMVLFSTAVMRMVQLIFYFGWFFSFQKFLFFLCFKFISMHNHTPKQRKNKNQAQLGPYRSVLAITRLCEKLGQNFFPQNSHSTIQYLTHPVWSATSKVPIT